MKLLGEWNFLSVELNGENGGMGLYTSQFPISEEQDITRNTLK